MLLYCPKKCFQGCVILSVSPFLYYKIVCMPCKGEQFLEKGLVVNQCHWLQLTPAHLLFLLISFRSCATGAPLTQQHLVMKLQEIFGSRKRVSEIILACKFIKKQSFISHTHIKILSNTYSHVCPDAVTYQLPHIHSHGCAHNVFTATPVSRALLYVSEQWLLLAAPELSL